MSVVVGKPSTAESPWKRWWSALEHHKGDRASLRRCRTVLDVSMEPEFHHLLGDLGSTLTKEADRDRVAAAAGVLAHVRKDIPGHSFADLMARLKGDKEVVSDARFRRLLRLETPDELLHELVRIVQMVGGDAPIRSLAEDVARWGDPVRKKWAFDYYAKARS